MTLKCSLATHDSRMHPVVFARVTLFDVQWSPGTEVGFSFSFTLRSLSVFSDQLCDMRQ
jgi:hypothetical protein